MTLAESPLPSGLLGPGLTQQATVPYASSSTLYFPGLVQVVAHHDIGSGRDACVVTHWVGSKTSYAAGDLTAVQTAFNPKWLQFWGTVGSTDDSYLGSIVTDMSSNTGLQVTNTTYSPSNGFATGVPVGDNVAVLVSQHTATRYRGGHGRMYLPGIGAGATMDDGRTVAGTPLSTMPGEWSSLLSAMQSIGATNGGPYVPVIWHKKLSVAPNTIENVIGITVQPILATQRRRLRKVTRHRRSEG